MSPSAPKYVSEVGGLAYPRATSRLSKGFLTWPFARATVSRDSITLAPRGVLKRAARTMTIAYEDLVRVERVIPPRFLHVSEGLRFHCTSAEFDRLYFATWRRGAIELVEGLRSAGVRVD